MRKRADGWRVGVLAALPLAAAAAPSAANSPRDWSELERLVKEEMEQSGTPGAALAIVEGDRVVFARGFGVANVETGEPVTPETLFRTASTTKMVHGRRGPADGGGAEAAARHAGGRHRSRPGPGRGEGDAAPTAHPHGGALGWERDGRTARRCRARGRGARGKDDLCFIPSGRIFSYSNYGYVLAGLATETAAGKPFADAVREGVLRPLGMQRSTFRPTETMTYPFSQGHHPGKDGKPEVVRPWLDHSGTWPAGCLNSSIQELSRFVIAFMNGGRIDRRQALSPSLIEKMSEPHAEIPSSGSGERYAYGLLVSEFRGTPMLHHGGGRPGFGSEIRMFPRQRIGIVALGNRSGSSLRRSVARACELMLGLPAEPATRAMVPSLTGAELAAYTGTFVHGPMTSVIELKDGKLFLREQGEEMEMKPYERHRFKARDHGMYWLTFVMEPDGKADYIHRGNRAMKRVEPAAPAGS